MNKMTQPRIYERGNTLWVRFSFNGEVIKKSLHLEDTKANRKLANTQIIPQMLLKVHSGEFFNSDNVKKVPLFEEFAKISFELHKTTRKISTLNRYKSNYNRHILPHFQGKRLDQIKPSEITLWQNSLLELGLQPKRVKDIRIVLSVIFEDAVNDEIIDFNPVRKVAKLPMQVPTKINPFSLDEIKLILDNAQGQFKNFFAVAFFTGMRTGEVIGLKWEDVNFERNEITVNRTINKGMETTPKTINSIRTIEILPTLKKYLQDQLTLTGKDKSFVFLNANKNNFFDSNKIRDYSWKRTLKTANVEYRTLYNTRHSFASLMISQGEDVLWVSHMLGHASPEMTLKKYTRFIKNEKKQRATFLANTF